MHDVKTLELLQREKPNHTQKTQELLGAFYQLDRERKRVGQMASPQHIKQTDLRQYIELNGSHGFELDYFEMILFAVDEHYLKMFYEKQRREANNG